MTRTEQPNSTSPELAESSAPMILAEQVLALFQQSGTTPREQMQLRYCSNCSTGSDVLYPQDTGALELISQPQPAQAESVEVLRQAPNSCQYSCCA